MITGSSSIDDILAAIRRTFEELFEIPPEDVQLDSNLYEELDLDSLDAADMRAQLQEVVGRPIPEAQFQEVRTVNDVVHLLQTVVRG
jgi:acyl carrier protein